MRRQRMKFSLSEGNVEWVLRTEFRKSERRELCSKDNERSEEG